MFCVGLFFVAILVDCILCKSGSKIVSSKIPTHEYTIVYGIYIVIFKWDLYWMPNLRCFV